MMGFLDMSSLYQFAPRRGFEPRTLMLTASCSTVELPGNNFGKVLSYSTKQTAKLHKVNMSEGS